MKTLSATAQTRKEASSYQILWMVEVLADTPGASSTTLYWGSREWVETWYTWDDVLAPMGISIDWSRLRPKCGVASTAGFNVKLANQEFKSQLMDSYVLDNDTIRIWLLFCAPGYDLSDRVKIAEGVIEELPINPNDWTISAISSIDKEFKEIPVYKVNSINHPLAPFNERGKPVPVAFGDWNASPINGEGKPVHLAPCRCVDWVLPAYTPGLYNSQTNSPFQYYAAANKVGTVVGYHKINQVWAADWDYEFTVLQTGDRLMYFWGNRESTENTLTDWYKCADNNESTVVNVPYASPVADYLAFHFSGTTRLGELESAYIRVYADQSRDYYLGVYLDGVEVIAPTLLNGTDVLNCSSLISTYWSESWTFELLECRIYSAETPGIDINRVTFQIKFLDTESKNSDQDALPIFMDVQGWKPSSSAQNYTITGQTGYMIENPVACLGAVMSGKDLLNIANGSFHKTTWVASTALRTDWKANFLLYETVTMEWFNRYCFEFFLHLYKTEADLWACVARDKTKAAQHFFGPSNIAVKDPRTLEPAVSIKQTGVRSVINEVVFRYGYDPMSKKYLKTKIRSPRFRYTGTCTMDSATGVLTAVTGGAFVSGKFPAAVGETIYVSLDQEYTILSITDDSHLVLEPSTYVSCSEITSATEFWGGSYVSGAMIRSWLRYKTINPLGGEYDPVTREGGFPSDFINDDDTADLFLDMVEEWYSQRRYVVTLTTFLNAVDVELGDVCYLNYKWLPKRKNAVLLGALDGAITDSDTTITLTSDATYYGSLSFRDGDYISIDGEALLVGSEPADGSEDLTVSRGEVNTTAAAHADGAQVFLLYQKWEVIGVKTDVARAQIQLELQEMPKDYYRSGISVPDSFPDFDNCTFEEKMISGWSLYASGLMWDEDPETDFSYART